ncbi:MAG: hypothetical protein WBB07_28375 [Mycobacterium sp.]
MGDVTSNREELAGAPTVEQRAQPGTALAVAALVIAVLAVALAGWTLVTRDAAETAAPVEESEVVTIDPAASKTRVCTAFETVTRAVQLQTNGNLGPEPVAQMAVAANARLSLLGGGMYLAAQIDEGTAEDLAEPAREFADVLQVIGMNALTGVTNQDAAQQGRLTQGEQLRQRIVALCA